MKALDQKLWRDLWKMRGQAIAIVLIVACGIASLITMMSAYASLQLSQDAYYAQYRFADVFAQLERAPNSLTAQIEQIPGVQQVQTRVVRDVNLDVPGLDEPATGRLVSIPETHPPSLNALHIRQGRYIEPGRTGEVLVSEAFARENQLTVGDKLGAVINGRWQSLHIVGLALSPEYIYEIRGVDILPDNRRFGAMWMGQDALANAFDMKGAFNDVTLKLARGANENDVLFRLDQVLDDYGGLSAIARVDQISNRFITDEIKGLQGSAVIIPTIFLGIAAFLLNLLLARLIHTQRDQIAVLKAFGYTNQAVGLHYLKLVILVMTLGSLLGIGIGRWFGGAVTQNYGNFYHFPVLRYQLGGGLVVTSILVSWGAALLGTFSAVQKAINLPPAEAMRPEPPAQFRPTLIEKMGLQRWFSPVGRIIVRHLERRPIQAFLSALGIAFAVAILLVGRYSGDAIQYLIDLQFRTIQREDITLVFNQVKSSRARYDLTHLPGVMQIEPFRVVPVRLRFEHRTYRTAITGVPPGAELHRLIDRHWQYVQLPPEGLVLSSKLAELLHLNLGDTVTVEVLEEERPTLQLPISGLVDEMVGISVYMDIHALNRVMQEGFTLSGAYLKVDTHQLQPLYKTLKEMPAIASVTLRQNAINRFEETIAASLGIFTAVITLFACIIAFGVIYNAARIALSERSRELATLRIIGFTQDEIAVILLGEQAILLLFAIPIGLGIGLALIALMISAYDTELYRLPLVITRPTYTFALTMIGASAIASGWLIRRQLNHLDLIAVLKTRE
ncbi:MAG: FtsX-like permease family protein [Cyanobacteria bacterium P01_G01_bin.38]